MSANLYIKQAVISALCDHPDQEKYRARAFTGENLATVADALAGKGVAITKQDFFTPDERGDYIIDTPGFWRNFERIRDLLAARGEKFDANDFLFEMNATQRRTLLSTAGSEGTRKIFTDAVWRGRFDEMESLWYKVAMPVRREFGADGNIPLSIKRALLSAEGRNLPEDRLARAGLTPADVQSAFRERGDFEALLRRLAQNGDRLRKEYILLRNPQADTCFAAQNAWDRYPQVARILAASNERLEVADFIRQVGVANNILMRAANHKALGHVFEPELWANRLDDMMQLWGYVLEAWKIPPFTRNDFDLAYAEAESMTYMPVLESSGWTRKADLVTPLNHEGTPVLALGLKKFWEQAEDILPLLAQKGERVTVADLRRPSGQLGHSCLMSAVKFGRFAAVVSIARTGGEPLKLEDFLAKDHHGETMLSILAARKELPLVFSPELWAGRVADMKTLWGQVSHKDRAQVDIQKAEVAAKQATLQKKSNSAFKIKPR